jgi:sugar phosphate isomerase/epimerase
MNIGLQLYTLRDETAQDFVGTLRKVAEIGYEGVEFAGYGGLTSAELSALLQQLNLKAIASHVSLARLTDDLEQEIDYNLAIGSRYIICPYIAEEDRREESQWRAVFGRLEKIGRRCAERGIGFGYHNHDFELLQKVEDKLVLDAMMDSASQDAVLLELDACWVYYAKQSPVDYIRKYAGRLPLLHLKDMRLTSEGTAQTVELGQGVVDLPAVINASAQAGVKWLIVEQDNCENPPLTSIAESWKWVQQNY